jgi:hypothetical protein
MVDNIHVVVMGYINTKSEYRNPRLHRGFGGQAKQIRIHEIRNVFGILNFTH